MSDAPAGVARHLPDETLDLADPATRSAFIGRLLEDGDRADLRWLFRRIERAEVERWFDRHAGRRLSRRSRAFWALVLDRPQPPGHPLAEALWPLA